MNLNFKHIAGAVLASGCLMALSSCMYDFTDINRNPLYPDKNQELLDGVLNSAYLPNLEKHVIPVALKSDNTDLINAYQISVNLAGDSWIGYHSPRDNHWDEGVNPTTYFFKDNWNNLTFKFAITNIFTPWIQLRNINMAGENPNKEIFALAQICKVMGVHRATDMFGPIPYSQVGSGSFTVEYDSQEEVYRSFFRELEEAIIILSDFVEKGNVYVPKASDVVYEGDAKKWIRLANSLMLRLAIRVRYADEQLARTYAEKAVNNPYGTIDTPADEAKMQQGAGLQIKNPLYQIADKNQYNDSRMGATLHCYLKGYNDPRCAVWFDATASQSKGIRAGMPVTKTEYDDKATFLKLIQDTPVYWMRASEVCFLKAEAVLAGFDMGGKTAKSYYEAGIAMSFEECGVALGSYLSNNNKPAAFIDPVNPDEYNATAPGNITVAWKENDDDEVKLERIITQKYLALYPNGQEAWSEWRRTGYPRQVPVVKNLTNAGVKTSDGYKDGVRRFTYPRSEYQQNNENLQNAIQQYLGGIDNASVNVWWDKKNK
ncbi:SusD/RagB family nutrient-binding outer membrane lipoprotein [Bacteroides acidifaciens]|uniref:SusD/RagB family nutrient-binding outer membrane lipoprotein n=1 Tax=Bacteroides acidifaciens TaxID=85831 RepID=UPI003014B9A8